MYLQMVNTEQNKLTNRMKEGRESKRHMERVDRLVED